MTVDLPPFELESFFSRWEFAAPYHMTASDAQTMSVRVLLETAGQPREALDELPLGYAPTMGGDELRAAVAATYQRVEPADVMAFSGAQEGLFWALQLLVEPGKHAVVTVPNYQSTETVPMAAGASVTGLPLWRDTGTRREWTLDLDRLRDSLRPDTTLVAVNFPNNPTGFVPDAGTFRDLVQLCEQRGIRLFSDEVHRGVEADPERTLPQAADLSETALSLNVMSKAYGLPGLRLGWIACQDRDLLARLEKAKHYSTICNSTPNEFLATVALRHADRLIAGTRAVIAENLPVFDEFFAEFPELFEWTPPEGGCVAFPRYLGADGAATFCRELVESRGVLFAPADVFPSQLAEVPRDHFRVGIGRSEPDPRMALDEVRAFLRSR